MSKEKAEDKGFRLLTTRKSKEGTYLHVINTKSITRRKRAEKPGDLQINEVLFKIDEKAKVKVYVRNAYNIGLVEYAGMKEETYNKKNEDGTVTVMERKTHQYKTRQFGYIQGTDGNLYLVLGLGTKAKGTLSEGWADLSSLSRNLVKPKQILDLTVPQKTTFAIDEELTSFVPVQVTGAGAKMVADEAIKGYKLSILGTVGFDDDEITNLPESTDEVEEDDVDLNEDEF